MDVFDLEAQTLLEDQHGNLWIGTVDGLDMLDKNRETFTRYRHNPSDSNSLPNNHIRSLYGSRDGSIWVGTEGGLCRFDIVARRFIRYTHDPENRNSLPDNMVLSAIEDSRGRVWIGTPGETLSRFIPETGIFTHYTSDPNDPESMPVMNVQNIRELNSGELFLGPLAESPSLVTFDPESKRFTRYLHDPKDNESISSNAVTNVYEDRTGIIWVLNLVGRIDKHDRKAQKFTVYRHIPENPDSLNDNVVLPIHEDLADPDILWIGTLSGGLSKILWIATAGGGLNRFDAGTERFTRYANIPGNPETIASNFVYSMSEERRSGNIWLCTADGIFSVEDTGMGIPDDQLESIFSAFSQVRGQKSSEFGGTGLGLAITKRLIEMMNGRIRVSSDVGKGSVFSILLKDVEVAPVESLKLQQTKGPGLESVRFEKGTILITDDIEFNRELLKGFLDDYDFTFLEAESGAEAVGKAREHRPDLILLDMKMPEMDGYEASAILKKDDQVNQIPVIAVTASAMKRDEERIRQLCDAFLKKPVSREELVSEIMKFLPYTRVEKEDADILRRRADGDTIGFKWC